MMLLSNQWRRKYWASRQPRYAPSIIAPRGCRSIGRRPFERKKASKRVSIIHARAIQDLLLRQYHEREWLELVNKTYAEMILTRQKSPSPSFLQNLLARFKSCLSWISRPFTA